MQMINPQTFILENVPSPLVVNGVTWMGNISEDLAKQVGWLKPNMPLPVADEYTRQWGVPNWVDNGDGSANPNFIDVSNADIEAQRQAQEAQQQAQYAAIIQQITPFAQQYRYLLRNYFGENAEINHEVTELAVLSYFTSLDAGRNVTAQQTADGAVLQSLFVMLQPIAGDPTIGLPNTWSVSFWNLIP